MPDRARPLTAREGSSTAAALPDDSTLTDRGLAPPKVRAGRVLLIACGALAREIMTLIRQNGWEHMDLTCLPAILHNHPGRITPAVRDLVERNRAAYDDIFVVYADCGTGGQLQSACAEMGIEMIAGPHCYSFYEGNEMFAGRDEATAFYLTDFLVRQFDAFVWRPLGLERHPELRDMYFGNYEKLVYQAQTDDPALTEKAQDCARRLGLAFERRLTGYGDLKTVLADWARQST
ncbi:DUF1638 domain-containing protein [Pontibaca methylaminivorans]|uniref:DUF1638 domain-containing protein n=1 Tax=Pontibaca methylaminivorans TaxID=515897 RepID=UPI002FDA3E5E